MNETVSMNQTVTATNTTTSTKRGIPGSTLKIIAIMTMFIDHIGAVIFERILINKGFYALDFSNMEKSMDFFNDNGVYLIVDVILRLIGRLGFPIFCFLLIEGFLHTRNVWKYAFRLFLFALISEIPFNLAFIGSTFYDGYQNVFFTLFLGLFALIAIQFIEKKLTTHVWLRYLLIVPVTIIFMIIANFLKTDYSAMGVLTIVIMYILRNNRAWEMVGGCATLTVMSFSEITAFFTLIPISKYNGERGLSLKYIFYAFYPVHLLILYLIAYLMGLA